MKFKKIRRWLFLLLLLIFLLNITNILKVFYPTLYKEQIFSNAKEYDLDPYLVMSVIKTESHFEKDAVSHKNASGLMQITKPTALWLSSLMKIPDFQYESLTEPDANISMGCFYLDYLLDFYNGNMKNALAAYNAGTGTVNKWLSDPDYSKDGKTLSFIPYPETRHYVTRVINAQKVYRRLYEFHIY